MTSFRGGTLQSYAKLISQLTEAYTQLNAPQPSQLSGKGAGCARNARTLYDLKSSAIFRSRRSEFQESRHLRIYAFPGCVVACSQFSRLLRRYA